MPKPLTFETFLAALTVVGSAACAKEAPPAAKSDPAAQQVQTTATAPAPPAPPAPAASVAEPGAPSAAPRAPAAVKPAVETTPTPNSAAKPKDKGSAACGAGACSADMKK